MTCSGIIKAIKEKEVGYKISLKCFRFFKKRKRDLQPFASKYIFDNRSSGAENLFLVLMGFQPYYWDFVLNKVKQNIEQFSEPIDVCLCVPRGADDNTAEKVRRLSEKFNFSYLYIYDDLLAQAQNTAIKLHPSAQWIYKIDEDIILSNNYLHKIKQAYIRFEKDSFYPISFISPLINLNAGGFRIFLETIGKWKEFTSIFPSQHYWNLNSADKQIDIIHKNESVAEYIWKQSIPFDEVSKVIESANKGRYSVCPIRMSIGAILFTRAKWDEWKYLDVKGIGVLGVEEAQVCAYAINQMQAIVIAEDTFVGHLGFFRQKETCQHFFEKYLNDK